MDFTAVIFVPALVGSVITGFVFALFAAHYYLTVLQSTAAGWKRVTWPAEPILDQFWKVFYLAWLLVLWLGPAWILGRGLGRGSEGVWITYAVPFVALWICYPISQLSSLGGPTIWLPLHPEVFDRLARRPFALVGFLILSAGVLAGLIAAFRAVFITPGLHWLFIGSPLMIIAVLVYASLLGRLSFAISYTKTLFSGRKMKRSPETTESRPKPVKQGDDGNDETTGTDDGSAFVQPSDLPPIDTPDEGPLSGYDVTFDAPPKKARKRVRAEMAEAADQTDNPDSETRSKSTRRVRAELDEDDAAYDVTQTEAIPEERAPQSVFEPRADEMRLLNRDDKPKPPKRVWTLEVLAFLFDPGAIAVIGLLSFLCIAVGGMVRIARALNPVAGEP